MIVTCKDLVEAVTDAHEGALSALDRAGYAAHLGWCKDCRRYVEQMGLTVRALADVAEPEEAPRALHAAVLAGLRAQRR